MTEASVRTEEAFHEKEFSARDAEARERLKYQVDFAQSALRNLLLLNGGAILSLLTIIGNTALRVNNVGMYWSFVWFGFGLVSALIAHFFAFYSQLFFYNAAQAEAWNAQERAAGKNIEYEAAGGFTRGNLSLIGGVACAALSLFLFVIGSLVALHAVL